MYRQRLDAKENEVQKLYKQILDQDQTFAKSYRLQEEAFREREEKMIVKLINEVRDQSNLRIQQQQKLGEQEEKLRHLQQRIEGLTEENLGLSNDVKRYRELMEEHSTREMGGNPRLSFENTESASNDSSYESEDLRQSYWSPSYSSNRLNRFLAE